MASQNNVFFVWLSATILATMPALAQDKIISRELDSITVVKPAPKSKEVILQHMDEPAAEQMAVKPLKAAPQPIEPRTAEPQTIKPMTVKPLADKPIITKPLAPASQAASPFSQQPAPPAKPKDNMLGTLATNAAAPSVSLWSTKDSDDKSILTILKTFPAHSSSKTIYELKALLLSSLSDVPKQAKELYPLQLQLLTSMGEDAMLAQKASSEILDKARTEQQLLQSDSKGACAKSATVPATYKDVFWQHLALFCQLNNKEFTKANFGLALLKEANQTVPAYMEPLFEKIAGDKERTLSASVMNPQTPLHFALLSKAKVSFKSTIDQLTPAMQRAVASSQSQPMDVRLIAGEAALRSGSMSSEDLAALYKKMPLEKDELAAFKVASTKHEGVKKRVLLYLHTLKQPEPDAAISAALQHFERDGLRDIGNALFLPHALHYTEKSPLPSISDDVLSLLLIGGKTKAVDTWLDKGNGSKQRKARVGLLSAIASGKQSLSLQDYSSTDGAFSERLFLLLEALGYEIPVSAWKQNPEPFSYKAVAISQSAIRAIQNAASEKRKGVLLLSVLTALGQHRPASIESSQLAVIVKALADNGFKKQARALALEAIVYYKK